jgi:hypothetical protein
MTVWTHIGNVQKFSITPTPTVQKHKGTQGPVKAVDFVNTSLIEMAFDLPVRRMDQGQRPDGDARPARDRHRRRIHQDRRGVVRRQLKFVGANAIGPKWEVICPSVNINAKEALNFIDTSDDTAPMPLSGDILFDNTLQAFGTVRALAARPAARLR